MTNHRLIEWMLRGALGGFFIWSGGMKLLDLTAFTEAVGNFKLEWVVTFGGEQRNFFAAPMDAMIAYSLPWFEIFAGAALLTRLGKVAGLLILVGMLVSFNLALGDAWQRGIVDLNCGCHGASESPTNFPFKIASNFGLMAVAGLIGFWRLLERRFFAAKAGYGGS